MTTVLRCAFAQWTPGIGDNNWVGWATVVVYIATALAALAAARRLAPGGAADRREAQFWRVASVLLFFLAVNKQLDLQTLVTTVGRCHAQLYGWYVERRTIQEVGMLVIVLCGVLGLGGLMYLLRGIIRRVFLALVGLGFVCIFVILRAASFHHMDVLIGQTIEGLRLNWLLELPGPILVLLVALTRFRATAVR